MVDKIIGAMDIMEMANSMNIQPSLGVEDLVDPSFMKVKSSFEINDGGLIEEGYEIDIQQRQQSIIQQNNQMQYQSNIGVRQGTSKIKPGQKVKLGIGIEDIEVSIGWRVLRQTNPPYDLDVEAFMLGANEKVLGDEWLVFYNQPSSPDNSCIHLGDRGNNAGMIEEETIGISLSRVHNSLSKIAFVLTINEALELGQNFGNIDNIYLRIVDKRNNLEIVRFDVLELGQQITSMTVGELIIRNGEWRFSAVGRGLNTDLEGLCKFYGVNV